MFLLDLNIVISIFDTIVVSLANFYRLATINRNPSEYWKYDIDHNLLGIT